MYGVRSSSNNNLWLRKKLIEAVNTRSRGGGNGSGSEQPRPAYNPRQDKEPATYGGAAAAAAGEDAGRRRRKKSAPTRASDGVQVRAGQWARHPERSRCSMAGTAMLPAGVVAPPAVSCQAGRAPPEAC